jgi:DMSO/TMAO reductase YedYZ molybdopterin-dependent catalytic subunit
MTMSDDTPRWTRRNVVSRLLLASSVAFLAGCDKLSQNETMRRVLESGEHLSKKAQRSLLDRQSLAREFTKADISKAFRANGSTDPQDSEYQLLAGENFSTFRLEFGGLVERPMQWSLAELRALPARTQITRHDCVEGWSCIGEWTGVRLAALLEAVGLKPEARYLILYCADTMERSLSGEVKYYESIDLIDARHEQTILAYDMNGAPLPIAHGAPLRLRVERQLGYKHAKYVMRIDAVESFAKIEGGKGGYWEDRGYEWYAGI